MFRVNAVILLQLLLLAAFGLTLTQAQVTLDRAQYMSFTQEQVGSSLSFFSDFMVS
jgi:hypothetical protein